MNKVLTGIFVPNRGLTRGQGKLHNDRIHNLFLIKYLHGNQLKDNDINDKY